MKDEKILVVKTEDVFREFGKFEGFLKVDLEEFLRFVKHFGFFRNRSEAEYDETTKQIIPYVVILDGDRVLLTKRTTRQTERRLHNLYSLGIGGHIRKEDGENPEEAFLKGLEREINEEVDVRLKTLVFLGLINSSASEVSRVHLGALFIGEGRFLTIREKDLFEWELVKLSDLEKYLGVMEGWSKIAARVLLNLSPTQK
ncbi:NUDIX domain-containing protein [Thermotoga sp. KOL6]|uniref:NUDIX domain-containing protein n=1 Tax=Thermotoga sp. KOL6 TaxID=126741 RepID=UPI000C78991E|nr:NUDIX domain-containing protein [Thermotoga sp. KOL6]PLV60033.1 NUDIX hydrolase [Thermotoga sp. KOL6]